jgi:hypothetical protein
MFFVTGFLVTGVRHNSLRNELPRYRPAEWQPRSDTFYNSALDFCYGRTGLSRNEKDTAAFKICVKGQDYQKGMAISGCRPSWCKILPANRIRPANNKRHQINKTNATSIPTPG